MNNVIQFRRKKLIACSFCEHRKTEANNNFILTKLASIELRYIFNGCIVKDVCHQNKTPCAQFLNFNCNVYYYYYCNTSGMKKWIIIIKSNWLHLNYM